MNFKDQLFHSSPLFFENNILKFINKITSVSKLTDKCLPYFMSGLHFQEISTDAKLAGLWTDHLKIPIFQTQKYGRFSIRASTIYLQNYFFFNCYLAVPWPTLGHSHGDSLTNSMLITVLLYIFNPKVTGSLITRLGP